MRNLRNEIIENFNNILNLRYCIGDGNNHLIKIDYSEELNSRNKEKGELLKDVKSWNTNYIKGVVNGIKVKVIKLF